jgi:hypothetical protein
VYSKYPYIQGGANDESFLKPKLTNRFRSEKTSLRSPVRPTAGSGALAPVEGPVTAGEVNDENKLSPPLPVTARGRETRLPPGLTRLPPSKPGPGGSMSREERKDVLSKSVFVLVIVRNESRRAFCCALGVPLISRILAAPNQCFQE